MTQTLTLYVAYAVRKQCLSYLRWSGRYYGQCVAKNAQKTYSWSPGNNTGFRHKPGDIVRPTESIMTLQGRANAPFVRVRRSKVSI